MPSVGKHCSSYTNGICTIDTAVALVANGFLDCSKSSYHGSANEVLLLHGTEKADMIRMVGQALRTVDEICSVAAGRYESAKHHQ